MSRPDAARLTRTAYAAHRKARGLPGGTLRSVQHAIADGRITIGPDGKLDPAEADRKWRNNTMPDPGGAARRRGRPDVSRAAGLRARGRTGNLRPRRREAPRRSGQGRGRGRGGAAVRETLTREQEAALDALKATILDPATPTLVLA